MREIEVTSKGRVCKVNVIDKWSLKELRNSLILLKVIESEKKLGFEYRLKEEKGDELRKISREKEDSILLSPIKDICIGKPAFKFENNLD